MDNNKVKSKLTVLRLIVLDKISRNMFSDLKGLVRRA